MEAKQGKERDAIAAAERWFVRRRSPEYSKAEGREFEAWHAIPEHAAAYAATEENWRRFGALAGREDLRNLSQQVLVETVKPRRRVFQRLALAAGVLFVLIAGAILMQPHGAPVPTVVFVTEPGESRLFRLSDGSQLHLNAATELAVRLGSGSRELTLRRGEAVFDVAHEKRPFRVFVGDAEVRAVGTRFQVRNDDDQVTVTLAEGIVAVERPKFDVRMQLQAGEQIRFASAAELVTRRQVDPVTALSWTTGRLRFRATPLGEAIEEVNRYAGAAQIRIADPRLAEIPISGTFQIGDGRSFVAAVEALLPVKATESRDEVSLSPR